MKLLDLFCCEGGAGAGYMRAGWAVTGIDRERRFARRYPGPFYSADAIEFLDHYGHEYDAIHTSPPCQYYTRGNAGKSTSWPRSIPDVRAWDMVDPVTLCGCMFDLSTIDTDGIRIHLQRPRLFETNWGLAAPRPCDHSDHEWVAGAYGGARRNKYEAKYIRKGGYVPRDKNVVKALLGIEHDMTWNGLFECVPPAYTEHIGTQLAAHIESQVAA